MTILLTLYDHVAYLIVHDVAVTEHGDTDRVPTLPDVVPVCQLGVALLLAPPMQGDG